MDNANRVVSSEAEELILVDADDRETGYITKSDAHDGDGRLHRAFSLFLFNENGELLLQKRASSKRLWPGYWSNSCCSHPRRGETMDVATRRRLRDELNVAAELEFVYKFSYTASFGAAGSENELCHVFLGRIHEAVRANDHEVDSTRFLAVNELERELSENPDTFTPWFRLEWEMLSERYSETLSAYVSVVLDPDV